MCFARLWILILVVSCRFGFDELNDSSPPPLQWRAISIGNDRLSRGLAAAIDSEGKLWTWGNRHPVHNIGGTSDWTTVAAGMGHACALRGAGELWCWGWNDFGQLGLSTVDSSEVVDPVSAGTARWAEVNVSQWTTCGIRIDGSLWCWGRGDVGLLGEDLAAVQPSPVRIGTEVGWHDLKMGPVAACAIDSGQQTRCWGNNAGDFLGVGPTALQATPAPSRHAVDWRTLAVGERHLCGIDRLDQLWCVGEGTSGQLGDGRMQASTTPVQVPGQWKTVEAGSEHTCAIDSEDHSYCWGNNRSGAIGVPTAPIHPSPVPSLDAAAISNVATSGDTTAWLTMEGTIAVSGGGLDGILGKGPIDSAELMAVGSRWSTLSLGISHACGIEPSGQTSCWGRNGSGQVDSSGFDRASPVAVAGDFSPVVAGSAGTLAIRSNSTLWGWGRIPGYGNGAQRMLDGGSWLTAALSPMFACAITRGSRLYCVGDNTFGQLGDDTTTSRASLTAAAGALGSREWRKVAPSLMHACALDTLGQIWCWGSNSTGGLGIGTFDSSPHPTGARILGTQTYSDVGSIGTGTCGLRDDGTVDCWGLQFGSVNPTPHPVPGLTGVRLGTGDNHVCAIDAAGTLRCMGTPHPLMPPLNAATAFPGVWVDYMGGYGNGCALARDGRGAGNQYSCWGNAADGIYGDGRAWALSPAYVVHP